MILEICDIAIRHVGWEFGCLRQIVALATGGMLTPGDVLNKGLLLDTCCRPGAVFLHGYRHRRANALCVAGLTTTACGCLYTVGKPDAKIQWRHLAISTATDNSGCKQSTGTVILNTRHVEQPGASTRSQHVDGRAR